MHLLYRSDNFWKASWKSSWVSVSMTFVTAFNYLNDSPLSLGNNQSHGGQGLDYRDSDELSRCRFWSNSLWQGWSYRLVHCSGGNTIEPIRRMLAFSDGISCWIPLKPQHSNPNTNHNRLANQLWCIDFLTPPTTLMIPHRRLAFLESLMPLKNWCSINARPSFMISSSNEQLQELEYTLVKPDCHI